MKKNLTSVRNAILFVAVLTGAGACGSSGSMSTTPSPTQPQLAVFMDPASAFSTSDVRDVQEQIVRFDTATSSLIWAADGRSFSGVSRQRAVREKRQVLSGAVRDERRSAPRVLHRGGGGNNLRRRGRRRTALDYADGRDRARKLIAVSSGRQSAASGSAVFPIEQTLPTFSTQFGPCSEHDPTLIRRRSDPDPTPVGP
jgi:hypothetical protein